MHEVEQGVWKALFTHLLRMLDSKGGSLINELDLRYVVHHIASVPINRQLKGFDKFPHLAKGRSGSSRPMPRR
jgi:hypothetical protein